jgi:hypothetical protein
MNEDIIGNDSNYLNLYLSSSTRQIAEITSKISSEFISINRKQERATQCISDLQNNMNTFSEGIINELTSINQRLLSPPPVPVMASNDVNQKLEVNTARLTSFLDVAITTMEEIQQVRVQSEFQRRMLTSIDDDVQYLREHHNSLANGSPASAEHQGQVHQMLSTNRGGRDGGWRFSGPEFSETSSTPEVIDITPSDDESII